MTFRQFIARSIIVIFISALVGGFGFVIYHDIVLRIIAAAVTVLIGLILTINWAADNA